MSNKEMNIDAHTLKDTASPILTGTLLADTLAHYAAKIVHTMDDAISLYSVSCFASAEDAAKQLRVFIEPYMKAGFSEVILACADAAFASFSDEIAKYFPKEEAVRLLLKKGMIVSYTEHYFDILCKEFEEDEVAKEMMEYLDLVQKIAQESDTA